MWKCLLIFLINSIIVDAVLKNNALYMKTCLTSEEKGGFCLHYKECKIINFLVNIENATTNQIEYLKANLCNSDNTAMFCCKFNGLYDKKKIISKLLPIGNNCKQNLNNGNFPWMVQIEINKRKDFYLSGAVIINSDYALTTAHSIEKYEKNNVTITGIRIATGRVQLDYDVEKVIKHPNYTSNLVTPQNDIALIKVKSKDILSGHICLNSNFTVPKNFNFASWTTNNGSFKSNTKMEFVSSSLCRTQYRAEYKIPVDNYKTQLCANKVFNSCEHYRNYGGNIYYADIKTSKYYLIGLLSYHDENCTLPYVFVPVANYIDWIERTIGNS